MFETVVNYLVGGAGALIISAAVRTMPEPEVLGRNIWYTWLYDFVQIVLANPDKSGIKLFGNGGNGSAASK